MSTEIMAPRKNKRNEASRAIAQAIIDQYQPTNAEEMQDAIKDIFGPMFEAMLQGEMNSHLGYESNDHGYKGTVRIRLLRIRIIRTGSIWERSSWARSFPEAESTRIRWT